MEDQYSNRSADEHEYHRSAANYVALSPISFPERAAHVYGDKTSIVYGTAVRFSWKQTFQRCLSLSSLVQRFRISPGDISVSTLEVEAVLLNHPKVLEAAVVGKADAFLKEVACAFVKLRMGCGDTNPEEIIEFCSEHLPRHMVPKSVVFGVLPVNFSGKVLKFALREKANSLNA